MSCWKVVNSILQVVLNLIVTTYSIDSSVHVVSVWLCCFCIKCRLSLCSFLQLRLPLLLYFSCYSSVFFSSFDLPFLLCYLFLCSHITLLSPLSSAKLTFVLLFFFLLRSSVAADALPVPLCLPSICCAPGLASAAVCFSFCF